MFLNGIFYEMRYIGSGPLRDARGLNQESTAPCTFRSKDVLCLGDVQIGSRCDLNHSEIHILSYRCYLEARSRLYQLRFPQ